MCFEHISSINLTNGEFVALEALELTAIPHISIIDSRENAIAEIVEKYKNETSSLLNEVYQTYKALSYDAGYSKDISLARRIYTKHFKPDSNDFKKVENVFAQITKLVKAELNDEPLTHELMSCVKVHLWRKIYYNTRIKVREIQIENSVKK